SPRLIETVAGRGPHRALVADAINLAQFHQARAATPGRVVLMHALPSHGAVFGVVLGHYAAFLRARIAWHRALRAPSASIAASISGSASRLSLSSSSPSAFATASLWTAALVGISASVSLFASIGTERRSKWCRWPSRASGSTSSRF